MTTIGLTIVRIGALAATAVLGLAAAQTPPATVAPAQPPKPVASGDIAPLKLTRVTETRAADLSDHKDEDSFSMPSQDPGLELTFSLTLPKGVHLMSVQQPSKITASDSAGTDLTKVEAGFGGDLEYLDVEHDFKDDDDLSEITLTLAPSKRAADTFDVAAEFSAMVFTGSKTVTLDAGADWLAVPGETADLKSKPRLKATDDGLVIEPSEIESYLEKVELQVGPKEVLESNGWFSDGTTITYMFDDLPKPRPLKAVLTLRTGVKSVPLTIEVKKQPLP